MTTAPSEIGLRDSPTPIKARDDGDEPFVSIAMIAYNKRSTIEECLSSIQGQDYPQDKYEVVVVDGGSTDGTQEILQKFKVNMIVEKRRGRGAARNTAVENCKGKIIVFTDADCAPERSWLRHHVTIHSDPSILAVAGAVIQGGYDSLPARAYHGTEFSALSPFSRRRRTWEVATCNASFKKSVFKLVGPFPELNWSEDCLLCWRILRAGFEVVFDPSPKVVHLHEPISFRSLLEKIWKQGWYDRDLQDAFGQDPAYRLPRRLPLVASMFAPLAGARLARYISKFIAGSPRHAELLPLIPLLVASSLSWTAGYTSSCGRVR